MPDLERNAGLATYHSLNDHFYGGLNILFSLTKVQYPPRQDQGLRPDEGVQRQPQFD